METNKNKKEKKKKSSGLGLFFKILLGIFIFIFLLLLFIRSPWGQGIIVDKLTSYISDKTNTRVEVDRLFITFGGDISMEGLYLEDEAGDTLIYSRQVEADIPLWPLIRGNSFHLRELDWQGGVANIKREDTIQGFNFSFLAEAFATQDTTTTAPAADTTAAPMEIKIGDINLESLRVTYDDKYLGIDTRVSLGRLMVEMQTFDLENMNFGAGELMLEDTRFRYAQTKPAPESQEEEEVPLPRLSAEDIKLANVAGIYESVPDGILADVNLAEVLIDLPEADLENTNLIVDRLDLSNSRIFLHATATANSASNEAPSAPAENAAFEWPQWTVKASGSTWIKQILDIGSMKISPHQAVSILKPYFSRI